MDELSEYAAIKLLNAPLVPGFRIPHWFKAEYIQYMFPVDRRPCSIACTPETPSTSFTPSSPGDFLQTSSRRNEDKSRREAMHTLLTTWDKSAKITARDVINVLFRGYPSPVVSTRPASMGGVDKGIVSEFLTLLPTPHIHTEQVEQIMADFGPRDFSARAPMFVTGGYSLTETGGPLSLLTRAVKNRTNVLVWVRERVRMSHGSRKVKIAKRACRVILFDRFMNLVVVPLGNPSDHWQFIRGATVALVQIV